MCRHGVKRPKLSKRERLKRRRAEWKRWREQNREKKNAQNRASYAARQEVELAQAATYREQNHAMLAAKQRRAAREQRRRHSESALVAFVSDIEATAFIGETA